MNFDMDDLLGGLNDHRIPIWDAHVHLWDENEFINAGRIYKIFGIKKITGIATPAVRQGMEANNHDIDIEYAFYLPSQSFAEHDERELLDCVNTAHEKEYSVIKIWLGPRFLDYARTESNFRMDDPVFSKVFSLIEDYGMIIDIHVADPDIWYAEKYADSTRYRKKSQALAEFTTILSTYSSINIIGIHFGCLPENLDKLGDLLDKYPHFHVDTASTKWMVRELGRYREESRDFITKYQDRILFATDLSIGWGGERPLDYYPTRLWSQRLFWETSVTGVPLPFPDNDNKEGKTLINGLNLPVPVLEKLYWKNAENLFNEK